MQELPQSATSSRALIAWGEIGDHQQQQQQGAAADTWRIVLPLLPAESVTCVACAAAHLLFVSSFGNVFSCGDNAEGALGHGDRASRASPSPVGWFEEHGVRVVAAMAGSGLIGAHSACISEKGQLYCWGVGSACGAGSLDDQLTPRLVEVVEDVQEEEAVEEGDATNSTAEQNGEAGAGAAEDEASTRIRWKTAACGGGFTVAITDNGSVYSWGMWARGRLGQGEPPELHREQPGKRKVPRFKLFPQRVMFESGEVKAAQVACGDAHTLLIDSEQQLWAWGSNMMGQLGTGLNSDQALADSLSPVLVPPFVTSKNRGDGDDAVSTAAVRAKSISCGVGHSLAIDAAGAIWTWGARGRACLGHNDVVVSRGVIAKNPSLLTADINFVKRQQQDEQESDPREAIEWVSSWSTPRRLAAEDGLQFVCVDGGEEHSAAVTTEGRVYLWGEGSALVSHPLVPLPVQCTRAWLPGLSAAYAVSVKCAGRFSIVVTEGDAASQALTRPLLSRATAAVASLTAAQLGGSSQTAEEEQPLHDTLCQHGRLDCVLLVQGKLLFAHRVILAKRSSLFREMLLTEAPLQDGEITRMLLADIHYDTAKALLEFIYTDTVSLRTLANPTMANNLYRAAKQFKLPKLQRICDEWLVMSRALENENDGNEDAAGLEPEVTSTKGVDKGDHGSTLAAELSELVDDMEYADVCFLTQNNTPIYAHMFMLEARSPYFKQIFQDVPLEASLTPGEHMSIVVPDSRGSMLRLLAFIYTGQLVETSHEALVDGIAIADRYKVADMKAACACAIQLTRENLRDVLELLQRIDVPILHERVVDFVAQNFTDIEQDATLFETLNNSRYPDIVDKVREQRHRQEVVLDAPIFREEKKKKSEEEESLSANAKFPWSTIGVAAVCVLFYRELIRVVAFGPVVPVVNVLTLVGVAYYVFQQLKT